VRSVVCLPGDGVGPEVMGEATRVLQAFGIPFAEQPFGGSAIDGWNRPLPRPTLEACRDADAVLLGAVGGPQWPDGPAGAAVTLGAAGFGRGAARLAADLAAQVRAWDEAGRPGPAGLHVDAYPRSSPDRPYPLRDELVIERPATRFVVYRA